jgi:hypothetical protein
MKRITLAVVVALLVTAVTAMAAPTTTYRGTTNQKSRKAYVKVKNGEIQSVNVPWSTSRKNCTPNDGYSVGDGRPFLYFNTTDQPIVRKGNKFTSKQRVTLKESKGGKVVVDATLSGKFSGKHATGTSKIVANANDQFGRHKCKVTVTFSTTLVP